MVTTVLNEVSIKFVLKQVFGNKYRLNGKKHKLITN